MKKINPLKFIPTEPLAILVFLGFLTTGWISFQLVSTLCKTLIDYIVAFNITFVMQYGSFFFYKKAVMEKKVKYWIIAIVLFSTSIIATAGLNTNLVNDTQNNLFQESATYKQHLENKDRKNEIVEMKKDKIKKLETMLQADLKGIDKSIKAKQKEIEMWKEKERRENELYYGQIGRVQKEIDSFEKEKVAIRKDYSERIEEATQDLERSYEETMEVVVVDNVDTEELRSTKGYLGLIQTLTNWTGWDFDKTMLFFQLFIAITFEFTIIFFHVEYESRKHGNVDTGRVKQSPKKPKLNIEKKPKPEPKQPQKFKVVKMQGKKLAPIAAGKK